MSFKGGIKQWRERNRQSSFLNRPKTAAPDSDPDEELRKLFEGAVLGAFNSEAFCEAISSQVNPALTKQQEKLNQLKTANLNLESTFQIQIDRLIERLEPPLNHVISLKNPNYEDDFSSLFHGQHVFLERLEAIDQRFGTLEIPRYDDEMGKLLVGQQQLAKSIQKHVDQRFDAIQIPNYDNQFKQLAAGQEELSRNLSQQLERRMEALETQLQEVEESVKNHHNELQESELRSALRFGELSNELQDRNTMLGNRLTETERGIGKKIDAQQRRVVGVCEELRNVSDGTQDRLSAIESAQAEFNDKMSSNEEVCKKTKSISEGIAAKMDKLDRGIRHDIDSLRENVAALDTSPIENLPRRLDAIDRASAEIRKELENQRSLAAVDSKMLSSTTARMDSISSNIANMSQALEAVDEKISDESEHNLQIEKLDSIDNKISWINNSVDKVHKRVGSLDISMLADHTKNLEEIAATIATIEERTGNLDKSTTTQGVHLSELKSALKEVRTDQKRGLDESVSSRKTTVDELRASILELQSHLDNELKSHNQKISGISEDIAALPSSASISAISEAAKGTKNLLEVSSDSIIEFQKETVKLLRPMQPELEGLKAGVQYANNAIEAVSSEIHEISSKTEANNSSLSFISEKIRAIEESVGSVHSGTEDLVSKVDESRTVLNELRALDKTHDILAHLEKSQQSQTDHNSKLGSLYSVVVTHGATNEKKHDTSISELQTGVKKMISRFDESHSAHAKDVASIADLGKTQADQIKEFEERISEQLTKVENLASESKKSIRESKNNILASILDNNQSYGEKLEASSEDLMKGLSKIEAAVTNTNKNVFDTKNSVASIVPSLKSSAESHSQHLSSLVSANSSHEQHIKDLGDRLRDGLSALDAAISKSQTTITETKTSIASLMPVLTASKTSHSEHRKALEQIIDTSHRHEATLGGIQESSVDINGLLMYALTVAENNSNSLQDLSTSVARRDDLSTANIALRSVSTKIEQQNAVLDKLSTSAAVQELKDNIQSNQDVLSSQTITLSELMKAETGEMLLSASRDIMSAVEDAADQVNTISVANHATAEELKDHHSESQNVLASHTSILSGLVRSAMSTDVLAISRDIKSTLDSVVEKHDAADAVTVDSFSDVKSQISESQMALEKQTALISELSNSSVGADTLAISNEIRKAVANVAERIDSVDTRIQDEHSSIKSILEGSKSAISNVLDEVVNNKSLLENSSSKSDMKDVTSRLELLKEELSGGSLLLRITDLTDNVKDLRSASQQEDILRLTEKIESIVKDNKDSLAKAQGQIGHVEQLQADTLGKIKETAEEHTASISTARQATTDLASKFDASSQSIESSVHNFKSAAEQDHTETRSKIAETINAAIQELSEKQASSHASNHEALLAVDSKIEASEKAITAAVHGMKTSVQSEHSATISKLTAVSTDISKEIRTALNDSASATVNDVKSSIASENATTISKLTAASTHVSEEITTALKDSASTTLAEMKSNMESEHAMTVSKLTAVSTDMSHEIKTALNDSVSGLQDSANFIRKDLVDVKKVAATIETSGNTLSEELKELGIKLSTEVEENGSKVEITTAALKTTLEKANENLANIIAEDSSKTQAATASLREEVKSRDAEFKSQVGNYRDLITTSTQSNHDDLQAHLDSIQGLLCSLRETVDDAQKADIASSEDVKAVVQAFSALDKVVTSDAAKSMASINDVTSRLTSIYELVQDNGKFTAENVTTLANIKERVDGTSEGMGSLFDDKLARISKEINALDPNAALSKLAEVVETNGKQLSDAKREILGSNTDIQKALSHEISALNTTTTETKELVQLNSKEFTEFNNMFSETSTKSQDAILQRISSADVSDVVGKLPSIIKKTSVELSEANDKVLKQSTQHMDNIIQELSSVRDALRKSDATASSTTEDNTRHIKSVEEFMRTIPDKTEAIISREVSVETLDAVKDLRTSNVSSLTTHTTLLGHIQETLESTPTKIESTLSRELSSLENTLRDLVTTSGQETVEAVKVTQNLVLEAKQHIGLLVLDGTANLTVAVETLDSKIGNLSDVASTNTHQHIPTIVDAIHTDQDSTTQHLESLSSDLSPLQTLLGTITTAIRVNLAAISRVDKAVLDTGAQIKGVIFEGNRKLGTEIEALDEGIHDVGTRIRGVGFHAAAPYPFA
ncbi:hypothetical protein M7I_2706 [Glarea lozoyensis 74030]|uniref:Uncharacterized protein n=1 Tax=Glarea lozoyensis (strain ATCC 74030 / MF5533) TaxID=1104152 RepID=H0EJI0_GLAL7|nr:hypothetical protein M7I_2706 [Glarea lozoyensis 74030]